MIYFTTVLYFTCTAYALVFLCRLFACVIYRLHFNKMPVYIFHVKFLAAAISLLQGSYCY